MLIKTNKLSRGRYPSPNRVRFGFPKMPAALEIKLKTSHAQRSNLLIEQFRMIGVNLAEKPERDMQSFCADPTGTRHALLLADDVSRDFFRKEYGSK